MAVQFGQAFFWDSLSMASWRIMLGTKDFITTRWCPSELFTLYKLVQISPISLWFLLVIYRTSFHGITDPFITGRGTTLQGYHVPSRSRVPWGDLPKHKVAIKNLVCHFGQFLKHSQMRTMVLEYESQHLPHIYIYHVGK